MQLFMTNKKKKKPKQKYYNSFLYEFFKAIFQNALETAMICASKLYFPHTRTGIISKWEATFLWTCAFRSNDKHFQASSSRDFSKVYRISEQSAAGSYTT